MTPNELAEENLKHVCAVTGASYSPDHKRFSPMESATYPGPWVRIVLDSTEFYISAGYIHRYQQHSWGREHNGTCYYTAKPTDCECCTCAGGFIACDVPHAENIASALLILRNNPAIFNDWERRNGPHS